MFDSLFNALVATKIPFAKYGWNHAPAGTYGIVSLEGQEDSVRGDNKIVHQAIRGSIDLFVPDTTTTNVEVVQEAINGLVAWRLNSVQYEEDTHLIHYEWIFEQIGY